jgi:hypothetical protein
VLLDARMPKNLKPKGSRPIAPLNTFVLLDTHVALQRMKIDAKEKTGDFVTVGEIIDHLVKSANRKAS